MSGAADHVRGEAAGGDRDGRAQLAEFAGVVIGMTRLLAALAGVGPLRNSGLSLTDWIALSSIASGAADNNRQLARVFGVTRQRANQIKTSLEQANLISARQSDEDARISILTLTEHGDTLLAAANEELSDLLTRSLGNKERILHRARRAVHVLSRIARPEEQKERQIVRKKRLPRAVKTRRRRPPIRDEE